MRPRRSIRTASFFYRLGDFYEMFFEDALIASKELEITLTGKDCGLKERAPMCGVPFHAVDGYLNSLSQRAIRWRSVSSWRIRSEAKGAGEAGMSSGS